MSPVSVGGKSHLRLDPAVGFLLPEEREPPMARNRGVAKEERVVAV